MDPLSVLRTFITNNELDQVVESGSSINFGGRFSFENAVPTAYRSGQGKGEFYDLQTLLFYVKNMERNYGDYLKAAKDKGLAQVKLLDRKDLVEYLTGKRETSDYIQLSGVPGAPTGDEAPAKRARIAGGGGASAAPGGPGDIEMIPAADAEAGHSALRTIIANERQLRDRNTMLSVPGRSFKRVLDLLDHVVKEEIARNNAEDQKREAARRKEEIKRQQREGVAPQPSGRYNRETAPDGALQQIGAQNIGLQQVGFAAGPAAATMLQPQAPPPPPPQAHHQQQQKQPTPKSSTKLSAASGRDIREKEKSKEQQKPTNPTPLIMVPPGGSSLINMLNAPEFLTAGNYKTPQAAAAAGAKLPEGKTYHTILRTIGREKKPIKYHVTDKEPTSKQDWDRVVGVFCLGKPWQFKKFPFKGASNGDLVDTFQRVSGVYLHYSDEPIDAQVKKWNVKMIKIGRHSREGDADAVRAFWTHLDGFIKAHKRGLIY
jgi:parafibromin